MASVIRIKRSNVSGNPATLRAGELAYSALPDNGSNGGDRLYIGMGAEVAGNAANHFVIGGKFFTDRLDHTAGTLTANKALVVDASKKLDNLLVDNLELNGNTLSTTDANGNLILNPNGTGKVNIANAFSLPRVDGSSGYVLTTDGSGVVTWQPPGVSDLSSYTTTATVNALIANSLTNYATTASLIGLATESYVTTRGYITTSSLAGLATESYVQNVAQGLHVHIPVKAATTASLATLTGGTVTYNNGTAGEGATLTLSVGLSELDGYTLQPGDRILIKNEDNLATNGVYDWATGGTILTRSVDENTTNNFDGGDFIFVNEGSANGNTGWVQIDTVVTFGTDQIVFQQFAGAGSFSPGSGLSLNGNIFNVNPGTGIEIVDNAVAIASTYSGQSSIATLGTITQGIWNADVIGTTYGGTGKSTYNPGDLLVGTTSTNSLMTLPLGTAGQVLQVNASGNQLIYGDIDGGVY
jgi:adhesin HecA-like repeat protein